MKMPEIPTLLRSHQEEIIAAWTYRLQTIPDSHFQQFSDDKINQWVSQCLDAIIQAFVSGSREPLDEYINEIAATRLERGFPIYNVTESILLAKEVLFPIIVQSGSIHSPDIIPVIDRLNTWVRYMVRCFEHEFSEAMHNRLIESENIKNARLYQQSEQLAIICERQKLARDLHDSVTQTIYSLSLYADATQKALLNHKIDKAKANLWELRNMIREVMLEMRLLIFELHPPILQNDGLATAIRTRLESVESRSGIETEFRVQNEKRLPIEIEAELYRIAQETLTNVVRHAQANQIIVTLYYGEDSFMLKVQDNGIGFNLEETSTSGGMGLRSILERTQRLKGKLTIDSAPQKGTAIEVAVEL